MSIRAKLAVVFCVLITLLVALVWLSYRIAVMQRTVALAEVRRFESWQLADELRQSSDELTRMARTFVVTGEPQYERYFNDILAIRNGEKPRPEGYRGIYWDFIVADKSAVQSAGPAFALEAMMRELDFTDVELEKLADSKRRSDALATLETTAMNAAKGHFADEGGAFTIDAAPDFELARAIMHGDEYHQAKADIMRPLTEFFELVDRRTASTVAAARVDSQRMARTVMLLAIGTALFALVTFVLLERTTVRPIQGMIDRLRDIAEGEGDLTRRVDERRRDELGRLAHWFNAFIGMVHGIVGEVASTSAGISSASSEIAATSRAQGSVVNSFSASTAQMAVAVNEIAATGIELSSAMDEVSGVAFESMAVAASGQSGLDEMTATMGELRTSTGAMVERLQSMEKRAAGVSRIVNAIVKVADQTNLLSINAAVEADKAGDLGAGFHVVAREIRHLADQTAVASLEIEGDVRAMQAEMASGHKEMAAFSDSVELVVERVREVGAQFGTLIDQSQTLAQRFRSVNEGTTQQSTGIEQINDSMGELKNHARQTSESLTEFVRTADALRETAVTLEDQVGRFRL